MNRLSSIVQTSFGLLLLLSSIGCAAQHHPWSVSREEAKRIPNFASVAPLSTNDYVRVSDSQTPAAVALLQDVPFVHLDPAQLSNFAPNLSAAGRQDLQPYLVRGLSFIPHPIYTLVKFDAGTGGLFIKQATYNGEMFWPYPSREEPNALVVLLPRAPEQVYPWSVASGDGVFAGGTDHR